MAKVAFKKGLLANLPAAIAEGTEERRLEKEKEAQETDIGQSKDAS